MSDLNLIHQYIGIIWSYLVVAFQMAQQPITQDIVVEDVLKALTLVEGAV